MNFNSVVYLMAAACAVARQSQAADAGWIARNPTGNRYEQVPLRLGLPMPAGDFAVTADGQNVPFQVEKTTTGRVIWVAATVPPGGTGGFCRSATVSGHYL